MSPAKTPAELQAWTGTTAAPADAGAPAAAAGFDPAAMMAELLGEFDAVLAMNPALDHEAREQLHAEFSRALEDAAETAATATAQVPDRAAWAETVSALQESGAIGGDEANALVRTFEASLQPLERRESRVALEFARRLATDGEEGALAWFRSQAVAASARRDAVPGAPAPQDHASAALRTEVVSSRSRRLRGPPRG